jgi:hypothetical protein
VSRRKYIPKPDGRQRPLGIASLEDKIVQGAVMAILTPVKQMVLGTVIGALETVVASQLSEAVSEGDF